MGNPTSIQDFQVNPELKFSELIADLSGGIILLIPDLQSTSSTIELKSIRQSYYKFQNAGWDVIAITTDCSAYSHAKIDDMGINYHVIHDENYHLLDGLRITDETDSIAKNNPYLPRRFKRRTLLVGTNLEICHIIENVKPTYHADQILNWIKSHETRNQTTVMVQDDRKSAQLGE